MRTQHFTWTNNAWAPLDDTFLVYDGVNVVQERDGATNAVKAMYTRGLDMGGGIGGILCRSTSAGNFSFHYHGRGNVTQLTDSRGMARQTLARHFSHLIPKQITLSLCFMMRIRSLGTFCTFFLFPSFIVASPLEPQVGASASMLTFSRDSLNKRTPWKEHDQLGWKATAVLQLPSPSRVWEWPLIQASVQSAASQARWQGIHTVVVCSPASMGKSGAFSSPDDFLQIVASSPGQLPPPPEGKARLLLLDRAGWVRRVQLFDFPQQVASALSFLQDPTLALQVGQPAPNFTTRDMNGQQQSLLARRGKRAVLLTFFPKCFTGNCRSHLSSLDQKLGDLNRLGVDVLGVSVDEAAGSTGQRAFATHLGLHFPLVPDPDRSLCLLYGAVTSPDQYATRMTVFIDKSGVVRWIDKQVNVKSHGDEVLTFLRSHKPS